MLLIILIMAAGITTGHLLRNRNTKWLQKVITLLIWVLLFMLGVESGSNREIINGFTTLGAEAFVLTICGLVGSIFLSWVLWKIISKSRKEGSR